MLINIFGISRIIGYALIHCSCVTEKDMATAVVISDSSNEEINGAATSHTSLMSFFRPRMENCWLNSSSASKSTHLSIIGASLSEPHTCSTAVQNPPDIYIYIYYGMYARYNYEHHFNVTCTEFHTS